jgi:hypothetical protein
MFEDRLKKIPKFIKPRILTILVAVLAIFNLLSTKVLPRDMFLVFASDINTSELVSLTNSERVSRGLNALTVDSRLVAAAKAKGEDMIAKDYWAHYGPNGESPWQFILGAGYNYVYAGENLAKDFSSAAPIHSAWMASPSHRDNILNINFENIGIAAVTGEFQGQETTIVVQMFGSEGILIEEPSSDVLTENEGLPTTGYDMEPPEITSPETGDILDTGAFDVRGTAQEGAGVKVFDNNESVGETAIENSEFTFRKDEDFVEGEHSIYARSFDTNGTESPDSNVVEVTVDTITPCILVDSIDIEYSQIGSDFRNFTLSVEIYDNPTEVKGSYRDDEILFEFVNEKWIGVFEENSEDFADFTIVAKDAADNSDEVSLSGDELRKLAGLDSQEEFSASKKWFIEDIFSRIFTRSLRGQINFLIAILMIILLIIQQLVLSKTGLTKTKMSSFLHLPVFAILIFVGLIGGGGEIL